MIYILKYHVMDGIIVEHSRSREGRTKKKVCQLFEEKWNEIPSGKEEKKNNTKLKSENHTCGLMLGVIKLLNEKLVFSNILFFCFFFFCFVLVVDVVVGEKFYLKFSTLETAMVGLCTR